MMPSSTPATAPMATAMTPTVIDVRAPAITRARTSRPYWSVPKGWELDGASRRATIDMASGSVGVHARLTTATVISASVSSTPSVKVTCRQGRRLLMAETRIERAVRQVHQEVDRDDAGRDEERDALHHRQVARGDGAEGQAAKAGKHEHRLEDAAAREQLGDLEPGDRHDGDPGGAGVAAMPAAASSVSGSGTGSRLMISRPTGTSYWIDTRRSPRTAWASQSTYWTTRGRSSPSDVRSRAGASGLPSVPMMTCAGSPGRTRITTKTRRDTTKRVATNAATLLLRYCRTSQPDVTWPAPTTPRKDPPTVSGGPSTIPAQPSWPRPVAGA